MKNMRFRAMTMMLASVSAPAGAIDANSIDTQIAWYKSQNPIKSDIKSADIIDARYAILIPNP